MSANNYILALQGQRDEANATIAQAREELNYLLNYLCLPKFNPSDADYIHIRTDLWPRLMHLRTTLQV